MCLEDTNNTRRSSFGMIRFREFDYSLNCGCNFVFGVAFPGPEFTVEKGGRESGLHCTFWSRVGYMSTSAFQRWLGMYTLWGPVGMKGLGESACAGEHLPGS